MYALVDFFEDYELPLRFTFHDANYGWLYDAATGHLVDEATGKHYDMSYAPVEE